MVAPAWPPTTGTTTSRGSWLAGGTDGGRGGDGSKKARGYGDGNVSSRDTRVAGNKYAGISATYDAACLFPISLSQSGLNPGQLPGAFE